MATATPKSDQLREMRERNFEAMKAKTKPAAKQEKLAKARAAVTRTVINKRRVEKAAT